MKYCLLGIVLFLLTSACIAQDSLGYRRSLMLGSTVGFSWTKIHDNGGLDVLDFIYNEESSIILSNSAGLHFGWQLNKRFMVLGGIERSVFGFSTVDLSDVNLKFVSYRFKSVHLPCRMQINVVQSPDWSVFARFGAGLRWIKDVEVEYRFTDGFEDEKFEKPLGFEEIGLTAMVEGGVEKSISDNLKLGFSLGYLLQLNNLSKSDLIFQPQSCYLGLYFCRLF